MEAEAAIDSTPRGAELPELSPGRAWAVTLVATSTMAISYLDRSVLAVLAPSVQADLGIDDASYGWLQSAFSIAYLASAPIAGLLLQRFGLRRGMLAAVLSWSVVAAIHAGVPSFGALFALRLALGTTESPSFPGSAAAIARAQPPHARARALGLLYTGSSLGSIVAAPLAPALAVWLGSWRGAFLGTAVLGLVWIPLWLWVTSDATTRARLEQAPSALRGPGLWVVLRHPAVIRASILVAATSPIFAFVLGWGSKLLVEVHDIEQANVGRYLLVPSLMLDLGAIVFGHFASLHSRAHGTKSTPTFVVVVALLLTLSFAAVPFVPGPWAAMVTAGVALAGAGGLFAIFTADMITRVGADVAATAGGCTASVQSILYVIANPLFGYGHTALGSYDLVIVLTALWALPGALVWLFWRPETTPILVGPAGRAE